MEDIDEDRVPLPKGWAWARLDLLADINPSLEVEGLTGETPVSFVPMPAVEEETGRLNPSTIRPYREVAKGYTRFEEGDLLFAKITPCMENGKIAIARNLSNGVGCGSTEFHVVRPRDGIDVRYLFFFLVQRRFRKEAEHKMTGSAGQKRVPVRFIEAATLPLAPSLEQTRIADKIEELFTRLDEGERALREVQAQLKTYRQAVLKAAVTGELTRDWRERKGKASDSGTNLLECILAARRVAWEANERAKASVKTKILKGERWRAKYQEAETYDADGLPLLPCGWTWASLDQCAWASSYGTSQKCFDDVEGVAVLRIPNVRGGRLNVNDDLKYCPDLDIASPDTLARGDLLVIRTNGSKDLIGVGAVALEVVEEAVYYASYLIRFRLVPLQILWRYINLYWQSFIVRKWVAGRAATSAGQYNISQSKLVRVPVPLAPLQEMEEIIDRVEEELSKTDAMEAVIERELRRSVGLRQSILKAAFYGKLVSQSSDDESAEVLLERLRGKPSISDSSSRDQPPKSTRATPTSVRRRGRPRKTISVMST